MPWDRRGPCAHGELPRAALTAGGVCRFFAENYMHRQRWGVSGRIVDVRGGGRRAELPELAERLERRAGQDAAADRGRRIALVGLRGAGKSTLGRRLADALGCPFIELDRLVEQDYGARIPDLIEMAGIATFRRYERACLERVIDEHRAAVVATAGGIVSNPETYALLLRRTHAVWVRPRPDEHMRRVTAPGRFRPIVA